MQEHSTTLPLNKTHTNTEESRGCRHENERASS